MRANNGDDHRLAAPVWHAPFDCRVNKVQALPPLGKRRVFAFTTFFSQTKVIRDISLLMDRLPSGVDRNLPFTIHTFASLNWRDGLGARYRPMQQNLQPAGINAANRIGGLLISQHEGISKPLRSISQGCSPCSKLSMMCDTPRGTHLRRHCLSSIAITAAQNSIMVYNHVLCMSSNSWLSLLIHA